MYYLGFCAIVDWKWQTVGYEEMVEFSLPPDFDVKDMSSLWPSDSDSFDLLTYLADDVDMAELTLLVECDAEAVEPHLPPDLDDKEISSLFFYSADVVKFEDLEPLNSIVGKWPFPFCCFKAILWPYFGSHFSKGLLGNWVFEC